MIDASSAILLAKAGLIASCGRLFHLHMTRWVYQEITVPGRSGSTVVRDLAGRPDGVTVLGDPVVDAADAAALDLQRLHRGERDTLRHFLNGAARFVIVDDGKAVKVCRRLGIPHINALLCPAVLHAAGRMSAVQARWYTDRIAGLGRYSELVRRWVAACAPSDLQFFIQGRDADSR